MNPLLSPTSATPTAIAPRAFALFLHSWLADPRRVGAVAPSGEMLAALITREILPHHGPIIELGAGTGVFTRHLIKRGIPEDKIAIVEFGAHFAEALRLKHPSAFILEMDASRLGGVTLFGGERAGAVISGLPLLSFSPRTVVKILHGAFSHLREGGGFYQFTYGPRCPVPRAILDRYGLRATRIGRTLANIPPATVYRISRRSAQAARF